MRSRSRPNRLGKPLVGTALIPLIVLGLSSFLFFAPPAHASTGAGSASAASGSGPEKAAAAQTVGSAVAGTDVNLVTQFPALQYGSNGAAYDTYSPPDVQVAAGPTEVVEMVNVHEQIFTKAGSSVAVVPLSTVFNKGTDDIGDPRIIYDNSSGRFFASVYDFTTQSVEIAVTKSSMAEGGWYVYTLSNSNDPTLSAANVCIDQPFIGVSTDKVVVTGNDYYAAGTGGCRPLGNFAYQEVWVVNKGEMASGGFTHWEYYYYPYSSYGWGSMRPVTTPTSTAYIVCATCGNGRLLLEKVDGVPDPGVNPTVTQLTIPFATPAPPPSAPHAGNSDLIDTDGDVRVWSTAWDSSIWMTMNDGCIPAGDNAFRSCARLVQVSVALNQVVNSVDVGLSGYYFFYPAVTVDSFGGLGLVIGYSSPTTYPSVLVTGVKGGGSLASLETNLVTATNGTGYRCHYYRSANLCRYGDYFGASSDPTDPAMMWFAGEYETSNGWATSVTALRMGLAAVTLSYSTQDGSTPSQTPSVSYTQGGSGKTGALSSSPTAFYMDLGSSWSVGSQLGTTASERWASSGAPGGQASGDSADSVVYFHQYLVTPGYSVAGGGSGYTPPGATCKQYGSSVAASLGSSLWADAKSTCAFPPTLQGSTTTERWAQASAGVTVSGAGSISQTYDHQYYVTVSVTPTGGGSESVINGWYDAGASVSLSATASPRWHFEGWSGTGSGAFSGSSADASFALNGPANETALFYPGLTISATGGGSVQYSFGTTQGTVSGGGNSTVYAPKGTTVTITPSASSFLYSFGGWSGALSGSASPGQVLLNGPSSVSAAFGYNFTLIGGLAAVAAVMILGIVFYLRRRPGSGAGAMAPTPPAAAQPQAKFCPNCGSPVSLLATFCNQCGAKIS